MSSGEQLGQLASCILSQGYSWWYEHICNTTNKICSCINLIPHRLPTTVLFSGTGQKESMNIQTPQSDSWRNQEIPESSMIFIISRDNFAKDLICGSSKTLDVRQASLQRFDWIDQSIGLLAIHGLLVCFWCLCFKCMDLRIPESTDKMYA